jgi:hypothetical protein
MFDSRLSQSILGGSLFLTNLSKNSINSTLWLIYFILFSLMGLQKYDDFFKSQEKFKIFFPLLLSLSLFPTRTGCKGKIIFDTSLICANFFSFIFHLLACLALKMLPYPMKTRAVESLKKTHYLLIYYVLSTIQQG